jgi:hypothetical protein
VRLAGALICRHQFRGLAFEGIASWLSSLACWALVSAGIALPEKIQTILEAARWRLRFLVGLSLSLRATFPDCQILRPSRTVAATGKKPLATMGGSGLTIPEKDDPVTASTTCDQNDTVSHKVAEFVQQSSS